LLCKIFLISCSPICYFFLLDSKTFEFFLGSLSLCLLLPLYSLFFPVLLQNFSSNITVFNPIWVDVYKTCL
jgi:hypothetical protein